MRYLAGLLSRSKNLSASHNRSRSVRSTVDRRQKLRRRRLILEQLEDRRLLATFTVLTIGDNGAGSLRQAIIDANSNLGGDVIQFDSGVTGTITLTSGELAITDAVELQADESAI